jgi:hypothetical protein
MQGLLVCFLKDYSITNKTDLYGNKLRGYELISERNVGGHMQNICFNYILTHYGRQNIEQALLEIKKYQSFLFSDDAKHLWNCLDEMNKLMNNKIEEIAKRLNDYKSVEGDLKGKFGMGFELL